MNRLQRTVEELKANKRKALVAFITAGYPDMESTKELVGILADSGVDIIELGVPFSDPVADGPTIQFSSEQAMKNGTNLRQILEAVGELRRERDVPIVLMTYFNPLMNGGLEKNIRAAAAKGVDGFIIPDLIPEESGEVKPLCRKHGLSLVFLAAPNTPAERLRYIDGETESFAYIVSVTGVTGGRKALPAELKNFLARTARHVRKHLRFMGFGISGPEQVKRYRDHVDGVIVGSALVDIVRREGDRAARNRAVAEFAASLRTALDG